MLEALGISGPAVHLFSTAAIGCIVYSGILLWWRPPVLAELRATLNISGLSHLDRLLR
jgi:hypothetical protein